MTERAQAAKQAVEDAIRVMEAAHKREGELDAELRIAASEYNDAKEKHIAAERVAQSARYAAERAERDVRRAYRDFYLASAEDAPISLP